MRDQHDPDTVHRRVWEPPPPPISVTLGGITAPADRSWQVPLGAAIACLPVISAYSSSRLVRDVSRSAVAQGHGNVSSSHTS